MAFSKQVIQLMKEKGNPFGLPDEVLKIISDVQHDVDYLLSHVGNDMEWRVKFQRAHDNLHKLNPGVIIPDDMPIFEGEENWGKK